MVNVLTVFLQNIKIQYHVVLEVCEYFFSGLLVVHDSICNTGISVEQDWNG